MPPRSSRAEADAIVQCNVSGGAFVEFNGQEVHILDQELRRANDPLVKAFPSLFAPAENTVRPAVEQATAAPGEKREA